MLCSKSIDVVGKYAKKNGHFYNYKKMVEVIPLAMVDDLIWLYPAVGWTP